MKITTNSIWAVCRQRWVWFWFSK